MLYIWLVILSLAVIFLLWVVNHLLDLIKDLGEMEAVQEQINKNQHDINEVVYKSAVELMETIKKKY